MAVQLFGEGGIAILPALTAKFQELGAEAPKATDATIRALAGTGAALDRAAANATTWATNVVGNMVQVGERWGWLRTIMAAGTPGGGGEFLRMTLDTRLAAEAAAAAATPVKALGTALGDSAADARAAAAAEREADAAARSSAEATAELNAIRQGSAAILASMSDATIAQVEADLELGASRRARSQPHWA